MSALAASRCTRRPAARRRIDLLDDSAPAALEKLLRRAGPEQVHQTGDDPGPAGLMARADAGSGVAVEVLVEERVVTPMGIFLEFAEPVVARPPAVLATEKHAGEPARDLLRDPVEIHVPPGASRTLDGELVAVVRVVVKQGPDDERVDGHPDRTAPVGVATEHARVGVGRQ